MLGGAEEIMANHYRSREGLSARPVGNPDEVQLRIDPLHSELDDQITGLYSQVNRLKNVAQEIESETKVQNELISDLQNTLSQAGDRLKNGMKRLSRTVQQSSNHTVHVVVFGLLLFTFVYLVAKLVRK